MPLVIADVSVTDIAHEYMQASQGVQLALIVLAGAFVFFSLTQIILTLLKRREKTDDTEDVKTNVFLGIISRQQDAIKHQQDQTDVVIANQGKILQAIVINTERVSRLEVADAERTKTNERNYTAIQAIPGAIDTASQQTGERLNTMQANIDSLEKALKAFEAKTDERFQDIQTQVSDDHMRLLLDDMRQKIVQDVKTIVSGALQNNSADAPPASPEPPLPDQPKEGNAS